MLEEINEEYYQQQQQNKKCSDNAGTSPGKNDENPTEVQVPYYSIYNAKPLSLYVKKYHSTGKVPVLLEYDINYPRQPSEDDSNSVASNTMPLDDQNVFVLSEASAINTYLYDQYGLYSSINKKNTPQGTELSQSLLSNDAEHHPLVPPVGSPLRGQYDALISCICTELDAQGLWIHRKHDAMSQQLTGSRPNHRAVFHAKEHFKRINAYLAYLCNPYLLGSHFSAADILYIHCLQWSQSIGWSNDTWPTIGALPPINVDIIKEQLRNSTNVDPSSDDDNNNNNDPTTSQQPPSILQPYLDLCLSRPAYQRAVQIRDGRNHSDRKDTTTANKTTSATTTADEQVVSTTTASLIEQWEQEQNHVQRRKDYRPPKSRL
jgi:glutathione S-transferase